MISVVLSISDPPVIDAFQFPARMQGERISVSCVVSSGDLPLNITWLKDGNPISENYLGIITRVCKVYLFTS